MTLQEEQLMTVAEFESFITLPENAERRFELFNGEMIEMSPTEWHAVIAGKIHGYLFMYLQDHPGGRLLIEARYQLPDDQLSSIIPDLSFTRNERVRPIVKEGPIREFPDLAVEIKSSSDSINRMRAKAAIILNKMCLLVWLVFPEHGLIEVYQPDKDVIILKETDDLTGSEVLPGFSISVGTILDT